MTFWNSDRVTALTRAWDAGTSITQIGKLLGCTRNAVVGKAHRLGLAARQSPIIRGRDNESIDQFLRTYGEP